jgi:replication-associated recombination protein RarA
MSDYQMTTVNGYDFFEVSSALQKCIRRGIDDDALYWGVELYLSNYGEYVWKRLKIMVSEDIGLAEPYLASTIQALYDTYKEQSKKKDDKHKPERLQLIHAILLCSRAKKSRLIDWALNYHFNVHNIKKNLPDFAYDKHTRKGKQMGRGMRHFFDEGCKMHNHHIQELEEIYMEKCEEILINKKQQSELL